MGIWSNHNEGGGRCDPGAIDVNRAGNVSDRIESLLLITVDLCILGCIGVVPLLLGGRHPLGQLLLVAFCVGGAVAWILRRCLVARSVWRLSRIEPLLLAAVALLIVQIAPLGEAWVAALRGGAHETLQVWSNHESMGRLGEWACLSLAPAATQAALITLASYCLLFLLVVQRVQSLGDVERLLRWIAIAAVAMAVFGLVQMLTANGRYFWFLEHHDGTTAGAACGSFLNRNHFAHFLTLGIGPVVWWAFDMSRPRRNRQQPEIAMAIWAGLALLLLGVLLSLSRGGAATAAVALVVVFVIAYKAGTLASRTLVGLAGVAMLVGICLMFFGHERVMGRLDDWFAGSVESLDRDAERRTVWQATTAAALDNVVLGSGAGTHRYVCPLYLDAGASPDYVETAGRHFSAHADNGPLEIFEETGTAGAALLAIVTMVAAVWCFGGLYHSQSLRHAMAIAAVAASLTATAAHNLVDCPWFVPGCMAPTIVLLAAGCRLFQLSASEERRRRQRVVMPRTFALASVLVLLPLGVYILGNRIGAVVAEPYWNEYRLLCRASMARDAAGIAAPDDDYMQTGTCVHESLCDNNDGKCGLNDACSQSEQPLKSDPSLSTVATLKKMIDTLEAAVACDPQRVETHVQLAGVYLLLFEQLQAESELNRMPLAALRDAAATAGFRSIDQLEEWLDCSVGPHYRLLLQARSHALAAARLCPLEGAAYLYLAELSFLECGNTKAAADDYIRQALAVRPFDGAILLAAGNAEVLAGDFQRALEFWKRSYRAGRVHQRDLIRRLAGHVCPQDVAAEIDFFLDNFQPDLPILRYMDTIYAAMANGQQLTRLRKAYAEAVCAAASRAPRGSVAADLWIEARLVHVKLNDNDAVVRCLQEALRCDPNSYKAHYRLALAMLARCETKEAHHHLQWCLARKPDDQLAMNKMKEVLRLQASQRSIAGRSEILR